MEQGVMMVRSNLKMEDEDDGSCWGWWKVDEIKKKKKKFPLDSWWIIERRTLPNLDGSTLPTPQMGIVVEEGGIEVIVWVVAWLGSNVGDEVGSEEKTDGWELDCNQEGDVKHDGMLTWRRTGGRNQELDVEMD